jgi:hypothetical protein
VEDACCGEKELLGGMVLRKQALADLAREKRVVEQICAAARRLGLGLDQRPERRQPPQRVQLGGAAAAAAAVATKHLVGFLVVFFWLGCYRMQR